MKLWKKFLVGLALAVTFLPSDTCFSLEPQTQEEHFSIEGTITEIESPAKSSQSAEGKIIRLKNEKGLELTFRLDSSTSVKVGEDTQSINDLAVNDPIEIEYVYNENYEKVGRSIKKPKPEQPKS